MQKKAFAQGDSAERGIRKKLVYWARAALIGATNIGAACVVAAGIASRRVAGARRVSTELVRMLRRYWL